MKKGFFAILTALTVLALALMGCPTDGGDGGGGGGDTNYTVTFNGNGSTGGTAPAAQTKKAGTSITLPGNTGNLVKGTDVFGGWSVNQNGTPVLNVGASYKVEKDITLYAVWTPTGGPASVTFNGNGNTGGAVPQAMTSTVGGSITLPGNTGNLEKTGATFGGWSINQNGTPVLNVGASFTVTSATVTLYAVWTSGSVPPTPPRPEAPYEPLAADEIVETIALSNGWFAIYEFYLPEGNYWEDYEYLTAQYKVADVSVSARARMMGNLTPSEIALAKLGEKAGKKIAVVGSWPSGSSGRWIMDNTWGSDVAVNTKVTDAANDAWFTYKYVTDGSAAHDQWNGHDTPANALAGREPQARDTGPFYLAVGLSKGGEGSPIVQQIKNVTLVGYEGVDDIIGMPLYFEDKDTGDLYRAYNGQLDGGTVYGDPSWTIESGETKIVPIEKDLSLQAPQVTITFNLNYDGAPAATTVKIDQGSTLPASALALPSRSGFICDGWFDAATGGSKISGTVTFNADKEVYAQWTEFTPAAEPLVIDDPTIEAKGGATGTGGVDEEGYIVMMRATDNKAAGRGEYDSMPTYTFPSDDISGYNKIKIVYSAKVIEVGTDGEPEGTTYNATALDFVFKKNVAGNADIAAGQYKTCEIGEDKEFILDLAMLDGGFVWQYNRYGNKTKAWGVKITQIVFYYDPTITNPAPQAHPSAAANDETKGSLTIEGKVVTVNNLVTRTNLGFYYDLPEGVWGNYATVKLTLKVEIEEGVAKLTAKKGQTFTDLSTAKYIDLEEGENEIELIVANMKPSDADAISFQLNSWGTADTALVMKFTVECLKIEFLD
jgi:uncharacterized repeat protein (TIGR02543 family)